MSTLEVSRRFKNAQISYHFFPNPKKPRYDDNGQDNDSNDNDSSGDELVDNVQEKEVSEVHEVCEDSQDSEDTTHTRSTCDTVCDITTVNSSQLPENMCEGECCRPDRIEPYQPKQVDLSISIKHQGQQKRSFQTTWFNKYKWLTYCRSKNVSFCFICRKVRQLGMLAFNKRAEDAFVTIGFQNWKNATTRFRNHEKSDSHKESYMKYTALKSPGVDTLISNDTLREQDIRRQMLLKQLSSLRFLARQGLPFRGHTETEGNFYQLMSLRANDDNHLQHWLCSQKYMSPEIQLPSLKPLCPTRWTVRTGAIDAVLKNYLVIQQTLEEIREESSGDISSKSSGLISLMDKFDMYFGLKLSHIVFVAIEQLATTLQAKDVNAQICTGAVNATKSFLQRQRDDSAFTSFFDSVTEESTDTTDIPKLPRKCKVPRRFDNGTRQQHHFKSPTEYFRQQYFQVFDVLIQELERRFDQESFHLLQDLETIFVEGCNGKKIVVSETL